MKKKKACIAIIAVTVGLCSGAIIGGNIIESEAQATIKRVDAILATDTTRAIEPETLKTKITLATSETEAEPETEVWQTEDHFVMTPAEFREAGVIEFGNWTYTWYSEQVLPGEGLQIPGRWSDGDFVRDENGYLCVASNDIPLGAIVDTPFGPAIVYDTVGVDADGNLVSGIIDIYVSW